jgi:hypothetical protein
MGIIITFGAIVGIGVVSSTLMANRRHRTGDYSDRIEPTGRQGVGYNQAKAAAAATAAARMPYGRI